MNFTVDNWDELALNNIYLSTGIILCILLIISECLAWSKCEANAITQIHKCLHCTSRSVVTQQVGDSWSV